MTIVDSVSSELLMELADDMTAYRNVMLSLDEDVSALRVAIKLGELSAKLSVARHRVIEWGISNEEEQLPF